MLQWRGIGRSYRIAGKIVETPKLEVERDWLGLVMSAWPQLVT